VRKSKGYGKGYGMRPWAVRLEPTPIIVIYQ
jgi:hypothetical protein